MFLHECMNAVLRCGALIIQRRPRNNAATHIDALLAVVVGYLSLQRYTCVNRIVEAIEDSRLVINLSIFNGSNE